MSTFDLYIVIYCAADRYYWNAWDPVYVCEGLFAVGNILNFTRLFHLLAISELLGPMLISLERMIKVSRSSDFKILQGSIVTQTALDGLTVYPPVDNFLQCIGATAKIMKVG